MATAALSKINPCVDYMDSVVETIVVFVVVAILVAVADEPYSILRDTPTEKKPPDITPRIVIFHPPRISIPSRISFTAQYSTARFDCAVLCRAAFPLLIAIPLPR
jgi:hypothetical protein